MTAVVFVMLVLTLNLIMDWTSTIAFVHVLVLTRVYVVYLFPSPPPSPSLVVFADLMTKLDDGREPPEDTVTQVMSFLDEHSSGSVSFDSFTPIFCPAATGCTAPSRSGNNSTGSSKGHHLRHFFLATRNSEKGVLTQEDTLIDAAASHSSAP